MSVRIKHSERAINSDWHSHADFDIVLEESLITRQTSQVGFWVGRLVGMSSVRYGGWGRLGIEEINELGGAVKLPSSISSKDAVDLLSLAVIDEVLKTWLPVPNIGILGHGPLVDVIAAYLKRRGVERVYHHEAVFQKGEVRPFSILIDTTGEVEVWNDALSQIKDEGSVFLITDLQTPAVDFNFYPEIHRRSLRMAVRQWTQYSLPLTGLSSWRDIIYP